MTQYAALQPAKFGQEENHETGLQADFGKSRQFTAIHSIKPVVERMGELGKRYGEGASR